MADTFSYFHACLSLVQDHSKPSENQTHYISELVSEVSLVDIDL